MNDHGRSMNGPWTTELDCHERTRTPKVSPIRRVATPDWKKSLSTIAKYGRPTIRAKALSQNVPFRWALLFTYILDNPCHLVQSLCHCTDNTRLQMKLLHFIKNTPVVQNSSNQGSPEPHNHPDVTCLNSSFEKSFLQKVKIIESYLKWLKWWRA